MGVAGTAQASCGADTSPPSVAYTSTSSDSCWYIIDTQDIDYDTFFNLNPDLDCNNLYVGTQVCVPATTQVQAEQVPTSTTQTLTTSSGCFLALATAVKVTVTFVTVLALLQ